MCPPRRPHHPTRAHSLGETHLSSTPEPLGPTPRLRPEPTAEPCGPRLAPSRTYLPQPGSDLCVRVVSSVCALAWWLTTSPPRKSHLRVCLLPLPALAAGAGLGPLAGCCWRVDQAPLRLSPQPPPPGPLSAPSLSPPAPAPPAGPPVSSSSSSDLLSFQAPGVGGSPNPFTSGQKKRKA